MHSLDYDWTGTGITPRLAAVTMRTAHFDDWARQFLAAHDAATVLHLGCGLDSRFFRLQPGPNVIWYDVDFPEVISLREQFYPPVDRYRLVPAWVTDPTWLSTVPADRPMLMIAEGLTMYLTKDDGWRCCAELWSASRQASCNSTRSTVWGWQQRSATASCGYQAQRCTGPSTVQKRFFERFPVCG